MLAEAEVVDSNRDPRRSREAIRRFCAEADLSEDVASAFFEYVLLDIQDFIDDDSRETETDDQDDYEGDEENDDRLYTEEELLRGIATAKPTTSSSTASMRQRRRSVRQIAFACSASR
jgi:hypothetical protein